MPETRLPLSARAHTANNCRMHSTKLMPYYKTIRKTIPFNRQIELQLTYPITLFGRAKIAISCIIYRLLVSILWFSYIVINFINWTNLDGKWEHMCSFVTWLVGCNKFNMWRVEQQWWIVCVANWLLLALNRIVVVATHYSWYVVFLRLIEYCVADADVKWFEIQSYSIRYLNTLGNWRNESSSHICLISLWIDFIEDRKETSTFLGQIDEYHLFSALVKTDAFRCSPN